MPARIVRKVLLLFSSAWLGCASAAEYFVSPDGRDDAPGTSLAQPFRTLGRAAAVLQPGDTCWLRAGVYREAITLTRSGRPGAPITFARWQEERVVLDGSDPVAGPWTRLDNGIWSAPWSAGIEAVFCDGRMMSEARWPDCPWEDNWHPDRKWATTDEGTALGRIHSAAVARAGVDLSGGLLYLKLGKGNSCHTRPITRHRPGDTALHYDSAGIEGRTWREDSMPERLAKHGFVHNRFFVVARGALDAPGEAIPGIAETRAGRPPSLGALETAVPPWIAGADWLPAGAAVPATPAAAANLARQLRPPTLSVGRPNPGFDQP